MIFREKEIQLKDGRSAVLRSACQEDAEELLRFMRTTAVETPYLMREA